MSDIFATESCYCQHLIRGDELFNVQPMVANTKYDFAARLAKACQDADPPIPEARGRTAELRRRVEQGGLRVSVESVRKWLSGESIPSMDHLRFIAIALRCNADWLLTGREFKNIALVSTDTQANEPTPINYAQPALSEEAIQLAGYYDKLPAVIRAELRASIVKSLIDLRVKYPDKDMGNIADLMINF